MSSPEIVIRSALIVRALHIAESSNPYIRSVLLSPASTTNNAVFPPVARSDQCSSFANDIALSYNYSTITILGPFFSFENSQMGNRQKNRCAFAARSPRPSTTRKYPRKAASIFLYPAQTALFEDSRDVQLV